MDWIREYYKQLITTSTDRKDKNKKLDLPFKSFLIFNQKKLINLDVDYFFSKLWTDSELARLNRVGTPTQRTCKTNQKNRTIRVNLSV